MFERVEQISTCKPKKGKNLLFGVEVEVEFMDVIPEIDLSGWSVKSDGSLRNGVEFVSSKPYTLKSILSYTKKLYEGLSDKSPVLSKRTSTHIHMDVRDFNPYSFASLLLLYHFYENSFLQLVSEDRRNNKYCIKGDTSPYNTHLKFNLFRKEYEFLFAISKGSLLRYSALNVIDPVRKFGSVEFRSLQGNLDYKTFHDWISLINKLGVISKKSNTKEFLCRLHNFLSTHPKSFFKTVFKEVPFIPEYNEQAIVEIRDLIDKGIL